MRRYKGTFEIIFGIGHRMRRKEMEEQFHKEARDGGLQQTRQGSLTRRQAVRIANTRREVYTVFVVVDRNCGAVFGKEEGAVTSIPGNEGWIAQAWVNATGSLRFLLYTFGTLKDGRQEMKH